ncbi:UNVERIFIED_CONTAM: hypothetical protein HDU68_005727 [Siphonaria sp. JEL0065]|nr:hypothetical protein HDU68_005727 [Siphonaria sp. JEL0065]
MLTDCVFGCSSPVLDIAPLPSNPLPDNDNDKHTRSVSGTESTKFLKTPKLIKSKTKTVCSQIKNLFYKPKRLPPGIQLTVTELKTELSDVKQYKENISTQLHDLKESYNEAQINFHEQSKTVTRLSALNHMKTVIIARQSKLIVSVVSTNAVLEKRLIDKTNKWQRKLDDKDATNKELTNVIGRTVSSNAVIHARLIANEADRFELESKIILQTRAIHCMTVLCVSNIVKEANFQNQLQTSRLDSKSREAALYTCIALQTADLEQCHESIQVLKNINNEAESKAILQTRESHRLKVLCVSKIAKGVSLQNQLLASQSKEIELSTLFHQQANELAQHHETIQVLTNMKNEAESKASLQTQANHRLNILYVSKIAHGVNIQNQLLTAQFESRKKLSSAVLEHESTLVQYNFLKSANASQTQQLADSKNQLKATIETAKQHSDVLLENLNQEIAVLRAIIATQDKELSIIKKTCKSSPRVLSKRGISPSLLPTRTPAQLPLGLPLPVLSVAPKQSTQPQFPPGLPLPVPTILKNQSSTVATVEASPSKRVSHGLSTKVAPIIAHKTIRKASSVASAVSPCLATSQTCVVATHIQFPPGLAFAPSHTSPGFSPPRPGLYSPPQVLAAPAVPQPSAGFLPPDVLPSLGHYPPGLTPTSLFPRGSFPPVFTPHSLSLPGLSAQLPPLLPPLSVQSSASKSRMCLQLTARCSPELFDITKRCKIIAVAGYGGNATAFVARTSTNQTICIKAMYKCGLGIPMIGNWPREIVLLRKLNDLLPDTDILRIQDVWQDLANFYVSTEMFGNAVSLATNTTMPYNYKDPSTNLETSIPFLNSPGDLLSFFDGLLLDSETQGSDGYLPERAVQRLMKLMMLPIQALHVIGYAHGDVKMENVLVRQNNFTTTLVLGDFGNVREPGESLDQYGTREFGAPEHLPGFYSGFKDGRKADVFAAGLVLVELLRVRGGDLRRVLTRMVDGSIGFEEVKRVAGDSGCLEIHVQEAGRIGHVAVDLLNGMLNFDPDVRFSAADVLAHPFLSNF